MKNILIIAILLISQLAYAQTPTLKVLKKIQENWTEITWYTTDGFKMEGRADSLSLDLTTIGPYKIVINYPMGSNIDGKATGWKTKQYYFNSSEQVSNFLDNF